MRFPVSKIPLYSPAEARIIKTCSGSEVVFTAHRLVFHSTIGPRVIKKKKKKTPGILHGTVSTEGGTFSGGLCPPLQGYLAHKKQPPPRTLR